ncbi:MAG: MBOAT family O-acyltransferase [Syntrophomonas sp.]
MLFQTPEFMAFLILTLVLYYKLPAVRPYLLALADVLFYITAGFNGLLLLLAVSAGSYYLSLKLKSRQARTFLILALLINIANLVFYKYMLFILNNLIKIPGFEFIHIPGALSNIIQPLGISFYTFQLIAYLVDIYREKCEPPRSFLNFWLFVSFFANVVAGPIMRGHEMIPQMENLASIRFSDTALRLGLAYFTLGLCKKLLVADYLTVYVDQFFQQGCSLATAQAWIAAYLFTFQIYYDFSAYSEMAMGIACLFGIKLNLNFATPYLSPNPTEFWRRWHITLSNWIRDYLYIPLGGSRRGELRKYLNLFAAMSISGLWHGAAWTFVAWGMYHGVLLILHNIYKRMKVAERLAKSAGSSILKAISILFTFHLVAVGWVFFRATDLKTALHMVTSMLNPFNLVADSSLIKYGLLIILLFSLHIVEFYLRKNYDLLSTWWRKHFSAPLRALAYALILLLIISFSTYQPNSFIYFKF